MSSMATKEKERTYEEVLAQLRGSGFDILEAPGTSTARVFVKKLNCAAAIERDAAGATALFAKPGYLLGGEIARLVDKGYQKFLETSKAEIPATADHLLALHTFSEELREAMGAISLYNESLGTVSDRYVYDRVTDRDKPEAARPQRAWQEAKPPAATRKKKPA